MRGRFITFEGIEGSGKTTQIKLAADAIRGMGHEVVLTREPGGTVIGERVRSVLLDAAHRSMSPLAELLLYAAARNQHVGEVILPALESGRVVLCDRYADATTAYQGTARRLDPETIKEIHRIATEGLWPDLTVLLDLPATEGLARARARNRNSEEPASEDRFEREALEFHERVRAGYLRIAKDEPDRVAVVDATGTEDEIRERVLPIIKTLLSRNE